MQRNKIIIIIISIILIIIIGIFVYKKLKGGEVMPEVDGGVVKDGRIPGYEEVIKSKEIVKFEYYNGEFSVSCELKDNVLNVKSKGGNRSQRDGTYFILDYNAKDNTLLDKLQSIIDKYNLSKNNGYTHEVAGLPEGCGDRISVRYKSGENIWKSNNQAPTMSEEATKEIYNAFHECAKDNNLDFNSKGSNVLLYDDADIDYLQGTWIGKHFGKEYKVVFENNHVKIYEENKLTDDTNYIIIEGDVITDKVKDGITEPKDRFDYEEFKTISIMKKKNDFTIVAYFMKESYSTCDLLKQK